MKLYNNTIIKKEDKNPTGERCKKCLTFANKHCLSSNKLLIIIIITHPGWNFG